MESMVSFVRARVRAKGGSERGRGERGEVEGGSPP